MVSPMEISFLLEAATGLRFRCVIMVMMTVHLDPIQIKTTTTTTQVEDQILLDHILILRLLCFQTTGTELASTTIITTVATPKMVSGKINHRIPTGTRIL